MKKTLLIGIIVLALVVSLPTAIAPEADEMDKQINDLDKAIKQLTEKINKQLEQKEEKKEEKKEEGWTVWGVAKWPIYIILLIIILILLSKGIKHRQSLLQGVVGLWNLYNLIRGKAKATTRPTVDSFTSQGFGVIYGKITKAGTGTPLGADTPVQNAKVEWGSVVPHAATLNITDADGGYMFVVPQAVRTAAEKHKLTYTETGKTPEDMNGGTEVEINNTSYEAQIDHKI